MRGALGSQRPCLVKWFAQGQAILGVQSVKISSVFFSVVCFIHTQPLLQWISSERRKETRLLCCVIYPTVLLCTLSLRVPCRRQKVSLHEAGEMERPQYSYTMLCERWKVWGLFLAFCSLAAVENGENSILKVHYICLSASMTWFKRNTIELVPSLSFKIFETHFSNV